MSRVVYKPVLSLILLSLVAWIIPPFTGGRLTAWAQEATPVVGGLKPGSPPGREPRPLPRQPGSGVTAFAAGASDAFGYQADDTVTYQWVDATGGTQVLFSGADDSSFGPVNLGFSFKFYENTYSQVYINTNGLLTFQDQSATFNTTVVPMDSPPNNIIAVFWDDLVVGGSFNSGKVYYKTGVQGSLKYLAVAWVDVTRLGSSDTLTFEALLFENGNIKIQYKDLSGELDHATVGIEDGDGVDGLLYLYKAPGLGNGLAVLFNRPPKDHRVKTIPVSLDGLVVKGEVHYSLAIRNTGEKGADTYNLSFTPSNTNWQVSLFGLGGQPLSDTNGDGKVDTGTIVQGATFTATVTITPPKSSTAGEYKRLWLTSESVGNPARQATVQLTSAVPVSFVQAYADGQLGINLDLVWDNKWQISNIKNGFNGSSLSMVATSDGDFYYAWERIGIGAGGQYANIELARVDGFGAVVQPPAELTDNSLDPLQTTDRFPSLAVAPSGHLGIIWVRDRLNLFTLKTNSNIYFAILSPDGVVVFGPQNLTMSSAWRGDGDLNIPSYSSPRLAASGDGHFHLAWVDGRVKAGGETSDIEYAVYAASNGAVVKSQHALTSGVPGGVRYLDPSLASLTGGRVLVVYSILDPGPVSYNLARLVKSNTGATISGGTAIPGSTGWGVDTVQLPTGQVALAWTNPVTMQINWSLLNGSSLAVVSGPHALGSPDGRPADYVSISPASGDMAVVSWMDANYSQRLYYAVIAGNGQVDTPPLRLRQGAGSQPLILTSYAGQGNASYAGSWRMQYLPVIRR